MNKENELIDYQIYVVSKKEKVLYFILGAIFIFAVAFIFYHSVVLALFPCVFALLYPKIKMEQKIKARKTELRMQFKDMLYSLSSSLSSGKSVESAFKDILKDLLIQYPDPNTSIILEIESLVRKIESNESVENALADFASRSHLEDIENFSDVFYICKRTGGNMVEVIRNASNIISDKIETKQEIETMLAERSFEQKILSILPVLMILLLSFSAGDYIAPIFHTFAGRAAMTIAIILLTIAYFISKKIMNITV
jgi:tight adherence protein B